MSSLLWVVPISWVFVSIHGDNLDVNICALDDPQLLYAVKCMKTNNDQSLRQDWDARLGAFGSLSELEVVRIVCKESADMGSPLITGIYEDYFESEDKVRAELAITGKCLDKALEKS